MLRDSEEVEYIKQEEDFFFKLQEDVINNKIKMSEIKRH